MLVCSSSNQNVELAVSLIRSSVNDEDIIFHPFLLFRVALCSFGVDVTDACEKRARGTVWEKISENIYTFGGTSVVSVVNLR